MNPVPRRILITGASRGIGLAIARGLAADGFDLALHCKSQLAAVQALATQISAEGRHASVLSFDLADRAGCRAAIESDIAAHGAYYGVVCNAGLARDNLFAAMSEDEWDGVIGANLDGFYNVLHPCVLPMIRTRKGGRIVVLSSAAGVVGNRGQVNYAAAKGGLIAAAKSLALELASRKITVNAVAPGLIDTEMIAEAPVEEILKMVPAGRVGSADEVAGLVRYLCSDLAAYITRQVISINGGLA